MMKRIALTVDLEPDWGVEGTRALREITPVFLRFLEDRGMRATFFVVSDLMDETPDLVAALGERNEIASHGCGHRMLDRLSAESACREMRQSRRRLTETGHRVDGFRAPFFRRPRGFLTLVRRAGYRYDSSMGSIAPGPANRRLARLRCPSRLNGIYEFPTSAMGGGLLPLSLTWLRVLFPLSVRQLPRSASLIYLHLHEFLPAETAACLPMPLRSVLSRNCGDVAWRILDEALHALDGHYTTCREILDHLVEDTSGTVA
jgi:hypothetical protein